MNPVAEILFNYLQNVIYDPDNAKLDVDSLPEDFQQFGLGLRFFSECVMQTQDLAKALAKGDLDCEIPPRNNELAAQLKSLHASLRHLTWQTQQISKGSYKQRVNFMGDFAEAFNTMASQLEERSQIDIMEKSRLQQYINLILQNTPNILLVFDTEGKVVLTSEAYRQYDKQLSLDEIEGKTFYELFAHLIPEENLQIMGSLFSDALTNRKTHEIEQSIDFENGESLREYMITISPMLSSDEAVMGFMVIFNDMTEIIRAGNEAKRARDLAEYSARAKSDFLARMSHEMRTPMNAIIGMSTIGKTAPDMDKMVYAFHKIVDASTHLLGVINDVLDMSKIEADKFDLSHSTFRFQSMLNKVISIVDLIIKEKEHTFNVEIDKNIPIAITTDEQRLVQVLTNLLTNAVKFTPLHGAITLSAQLMESTEASCTIRFIVKDTGIGISEDQQKVLFTPFEQADGSITRRFGGTGLGLSISRSIVEMMGGRIWIESELGKGSSFIFEIKAGIGDEANINEITPIEINEQGTLEGKRILIAEDIDINREIVSALLEDTGVIIDFAVNGSEAVDRFLSAPVTHDLILMDIQMPLMDGYEAARRIRASGHECADKIPIIAMTANVFAEDVERCLAAGMNDHLGKPVNVDEVVQKLKEYLLPAEVAEGAEVAQD